LESCQQRSYILVEGEMDGNVTEDRRLLTFTGFLRILSSHQWDEDEKEILAVVRSNYPFL